MLFAKQDFNPPVLSRKWLCLKFRPNMLLQCRDNIITILESGLMFREDSTSIEELMPTSEAMWLAAGGGKTGWLTTGERFVVVFSAAAIVAIVPIKRVSLRSAAWQLAAAIGVAASARMAMRRRARGFVADFIAISRDYTALLRRTMACVKEYKLLGKGIESIWSVIKSTNETLVTQQTELCLTLCRCSSAILGNVPWLKEDVTWATVDFVTETQLQGCISDADVLKVHHTYLVVQSAFLKHLAMAHFVQPQKSKKIYKNHNERLYWLHNEMLNYLNSFYKENYETLDRMYRLLKNCGDFDVNSDRKSAPRLNTSWLYSDIQCGVARSAIELKLILSKTAKLDAFLDSCALSNADLDIDVLIDDIGSVVEDVTKCLANLQSSELKLRKMYKKSNNSNENINKYEDVDERKIVMIDDSPPKMKDEVFYLHNTGDDDEFIDEYADITTAPGKKEVENSKIVLNELKTKLVKRENVMREREKIALAYTMPELRDKLPEFPRQFKDNTVSCGYIHKLLCKTNKNKSYLIKRFISKRRDRKIFKHARFTKNIIRDSSQFKKCCKLDKDFNNHIDLDVKCIDGKKILIIYKHNKILKDIPKSTAVKTCESTGLNISSCASRGGSNESSEVNGINSKLNKSSEKSEDTLHDFSDSLSSDCDDTPKPCKSKLKMIRSKVIDERSANVDSLDDSSNSDFEGLKRREMLRDVRKYRPKRRKQYPKENSDSPSEAIDDGLRPVQYSFRANAAMAALLQTKNPMMIEEIVFTADGLLSSDSGNNEEDA